MNRCFLGAWVRDMIQVVIMTRSSGRSAGNVACPVGCDWFRHARAVWLMNFLPPARAPPSPLSRRRLPLRVLSPQLLPTCSGEQLGLPEGRRGAGSLSPAAAGSGSYWVKQLKLSWPLLKLAGTFPSSGPNDTEMGTPLRVSPGCKGSCKVGDSKGGATLWPGGSVGPLRGWGDCAQSGRLGEARPCNQC
jgi:hypothetical protein